MPPRSRPPLAASGLRAGLARARSLPALAALPELAGAIPTSGAAEALERAIAGALADTLTDPVPLLVVAGSLYLVGEARLWLRGRYGVPAAAADIATWEPDD